MTTRISTQPATVPTVRVDRHTVTVAGATVGYCDLIDADTFAARLRGALAEAFTAGQDHARAEVRRIAEACTEHDDPACLFGDDCCINGADLVGGNDRTDGLMEWLTR